MKIIAVHAYTVRTRPKVPFVGRKGLPGSDPVKDDGICKSLNNTLEGWLFLPKLKAGQPADCKISVSRQF